jgi:hypothetical protein
VSWWFAGIFDEQVRKVCQSERDALTSMAGQSQSQLMQMLQHIMMQQEANIQQLAAIPEGSLSLPSHHSPLTSSIALANCSMRAFLRRVVRCHA